MEAECPAILHELAQGVAGGQNPLRATGRARPKAGLKRDSGDQEVGAFLYLINSVFVGGLVQEREANIGGATSR